MQNDKTKNCYEDVMKVLISDKNEVRVILQKETVKNTRCLFLLQHLWD